MTEQIAKLPTWRACFKDTTLLALPILGAHVIEALIPFINTTLAASLGETPLAAAGLVSSTFLAFMGFCWGIIASVGIISANLLGEGKGKQEVGIVLWAGFITSVLLSLPVMLIFNNMHLVWNYFGQDQAVIYQAQAYMHTLAYAVPADLAKFAIFQFAIACNKPRIPLIANILSIPLLVFITTYTIQADGIAGIGLGTAITYSIIFVAMLAYLLVNNQFKSYILHSYKLTELAEVCTHQLKLGIPIGAMFSIELLFFMTITLLMGKISLSTLAANQIAMQWMWLTVMFAYGFTEAVTILVAKANGARDFASLVRFCYTGIYLAGICMFVVAAVYWISPQSVIQWDLTISEENEATVHLATRLLFLCGFYQILDSIRIVVSGALRGMEDSQYPMWVTAGSFWLIGLPIGYVCAFVLNLQAIGLWAGLLSSVLVSMTLQYFRLQRMVIVKDSEQVASEEAIEQA